MEKKTIKKEVTQFNASFKNQGKIKRSRGFAFVSCPDFRNDGAKYAYGESIGGDLPLYMQLATEELKFLQLQKPVHVFLSDHELHYADLIERMGESAESVKEKIESSLGFVRKDFPEARLLSEKYSYESVLLLRPTVPKDANFQNEVSNWGNENVSRELLEDRYFNRFAQMKAFMIFCNSEDICPVFIYSIFNFKIVSLIRKQINMPVFFLDV